MTDPIVLTRKGSLWLIDLLDNPPPSNAKFKAAQAHYNLYVANAIRRAQRDS
jgi:uncharacterized protein (DUF1778 family)